MTGRSGSGDQLAARVLVGVFFVTGFAALGLQVAWHRVLALHSGVDLGSATTVVVAFLLGLGIGNLLGGRLADRVTPRSSLLALAAAEAGVAVFAVVSVPVLRRVPDALLPAGWNAVPAFGLYALLLLPATVLMGLTIPLAARVLTADGPDAGQRVGRVYGVNTLGAAAGALVTGWLLIGSLGVQTATRLAALAELAAVAVILLLWRRYEPGTPTSTVERASGSAVPGAVWPWVCVYGVTGGVALALQQVFFRVIDTAMRSNSYSFSLVLCVYLACFGLGSTVGSRFVSRMADPRRTFLAVQIGVALAAAVPLVALGRNLPVPGLDEWFGGEGFRAGFGSITDPAEVIRIVRFGILLPLALVGPAAVLMGVSFPLIEQVVAGEPGRVGRRTGLLLAVNLVGNVGGALLATFVLIDRLGTMGTLRLLTVLLVVGSLAGLAVLARGVSPRLVGVGAASVLVLALVPGGGALWARLHGTDAGSLLVAEDRSCISALTMSEDGTATLVLNGAPQNTHPFDDFHVLIGLLPALAHPAPERALAVGLGIGSTSYGILRRPDITELTTAELCGGNLELVERTAADRVEFDELVDDPRHTHVVRDGRSVLRSDSEPLDVVAVDTLLPESGSSGNTYSREFYELVLDSLTDDGIFAQWVPTDRVLNTAAQVFPYLVTVNVDTYGSTFLLGSRSPIDLESDTLLRRFDSDAATSFPGAQGDRLRELLSGLNARCIRAGTPSPRIPAEITNTDLHPRDEYFLNNPRTIPKRPEVVDPDCG